MKRNKTNEQKTDKSITKKVIISVCAVILVCICFFGYFIYKVSGNEIAKNVYISDINVSGMDRNTARKKLEDSYTLKDPVLVYNKKEWTIPKEQAKLVYNIDKTVDDAFKVNRNDNLANNVLKTIKLSFGEKEKINISINYDREFMKKKLDEISKDVNSEVKDATLEVVSVNDKDAKADDKNADAKADDKNAENKNAENGSAANEIDAKIVKEEPGIKLNAERTLASIRKNLGNEVYKTEIQVDKIPAKVTEADLKGINTLLGQFSTTFTSGYPGRNANIRLATKTSSNVILKPGETYSFNKLTGMRTLQNGYTYAPVIEEGKLVQGIGGGVCQVSSTIFNAVLESGLDITVHRNHTIPSDYVVKGRDATVTDSGQDFAFKNNFKHNIYLKNSLSGNKITTQIFGNAEDYQNIEISTEVVGYSGAGSKEIKDPNLPEGKRVVEKMGRAGSTVNTYRVIKDKDGNVIKREKIATNVYPSKAGVIRVGTKKAQPDAQAAKQQAGKDDNAQKQQAENQPQTNVPKQPVQNQNGR